MVGTGDNDGRITWISDSVTTVLAWMAHDIVGRPFSEFVHPEDLPTVANAQLGAGVGERIGMDLRLVCADCSYRPMEILLAPMVDDVGVVVGRVAGGETVRADSKRSKRCRLGDARSAGGECCRIHSLGIFEYLRAPGCRVGWLMAAIIGPSGEASPETARVVRAPGRAQ